jgi:hypothetical protein
MNIFYLDNDPTTCAQMHNDKHVVKMILEYAQLLSTAHRILDGTEFTGVSKTGRKQTRFVLSDSRESVLYSSTHANHPSAIWVRKSYENYVWLYQLFLAVLKEYTHRYGKLHACEKLVDVLRTSPTNIPKGVGFTEPTPAMPDEVKIVGSSLASYKNYYIKNKAHLASWKKRNIPEWYANV